MLTLFSPKYGRRLACPARTPVQANTSQDPGRSVYSAHRDRSIQRNQWPCWASGTPALLSTTYGLGSELHRPLQLRAAHGGVHDLLPNPADLDRDRALQRFAFLKTMDEILHRVLVRRRSRGGGD